MDKPNVEDKTKFIPDEKTNEKVKENYAKKPELFFVESGATQAQILKADKDGQKLVFDITAFPDVSLPTLSAMSRDNRIGYQQDARLAKRAGDRMSEGKSPYTDMRDKLVAQDPLHVANNVGRTGRVEKGNSKLHYLAAEPRNVDRMKRAGYKLVKPGEADVVNGVEKGERIVLMGDNGKIDNVMMSVGKEDYDKHVEIQGQKSQARLGENTEATKDRLDKYSSKVTVYDDSNFDNIRPRKI